MSATDFEQHEMANLNASYPPLTLAQKVQQILDTPLMPVIGLATIFMAALFNLVDFEVHNETVGINRQVLIKMFVLMIGGLYGAYGFINDVNVRNTVLTFPMLWIVIIFGFFCLAIPGSMTPVESMVSTMSIASIVLLTVTALVQVGTFRVLNTVFCALGTFVFLSWVAVLAFPEFGIFLEPLSDQEFARRFGGLAHPNTLGQFSGLTIVLGLLLYSRFEQKSRWRIIVILMAGGALIGSISRTSMLATLIAIVVVYRREIFQRKNLVWIFGLAMIGVLGLMFLSITTDLGQLIASKLPFLSKSGDADELFSATGRSEIWAYAIQLIGERPLTGYGAATSKYFLSEYSHYTHNLILHVAFSTGILGGLAAVCMCLGRAIALITNHHPIADALVAFILINGLFENVMFSILAGLPTMIWTIALCLPLLPSEQRKAEEMPPSDNLIDQEATSPRSAT